MKKKLCSLKHLSFLVFYILIFAGCNDDQAIEDIATKQWKLVSILETNSDIPKSPRDVNFLQTDAYVIKFLNDTSFSLNTSVNQAGGEYIISTEEKIHFAYQEFTEVGTINSDDIEFDRDLIRVLNMVSEYSLTGTKLILTGEGGMLTFSIKN